MIRGGNLTIKGLRKEDHGRFECVLENEIATLVTSTLLLVEGMSMLLVISIKKVLGVYEK